MAMRVVAFALAAAVFALGASLIMTALGEARRRWRQRWRPTSATKGNVTAELMADPVTIEGGPADGLQVSAGSRFAWLDVTVLKRAERTPTAGLYELRDGIYEYVGGHRLVCSCGGVFDRSAGACPMCGAERQVA